MRREESCDVEVRYKTESEERSEDVEATDLRKLSP